MAENKEQLAQRTSRIDDELKGEGYGTYMRREDVQKVLSISSARAYQLLHNGEIEATRLSNELRFSRSSIARYAAMGYVTQPKAPKGIAAMHGKPQKLAHRAATAPARPQGTKLNRPR